MHPLAEASHKAGETRRIERLAELAFTSILFAAVLAVAILAFSTGTEAAIGAPHPGAHALIEKLTKALLEDPDNPDLYLSRGHAHFRAEHMEKALDDYKKVQLLLPNNADGYFSEARLQSAQASTEKALSLVNKVLVLEPASLPALHLRAQLYFQTGSLKSSYKDFLSLLERVESPTVELWLEAAAAAAKAESPEKAVTMLDMAIEQIGDLSSIHIAAARYAARAGNAGEALARLERLQLQVPKIPDASLSILEREIETLLKDTPNEHET